MFYIKIPFLDLDSCYSTEQGVTWYRIKEGKYCITSGENFIVVEQGYKGNFGFACSEDDFYNKWYDYFMVDYDYLEANYTTRHNGKDFKRMGVRGSGLRILREEFVDVLVREIFREKFNTRAQVAVYTEMFKKSVGKKHKNSTRGSGNFVWYDMPDVDTILKSYKKVIAEFKQLPKKIHKDIIWCLKTIKTILTDTSDGWFTPDEYKSNKYNSWELLDLLLSYDLDLDTAKRICIYCFGKLDLFIMDEKIDECINGLDEEYEDVDEFVAWNLSEPKLEKRAAYINMLMRYEVDVPPRKGDEILWES